MPVFDAEGTQRHVVEVWKEASGARWRRDIAAALGPDGSGSNGGGDSPASPAAGLRKLLGRHLGSGGTSRDVVAMSERASTGPAALSAQQLAEEHEARTSSAAARHRSVSGALLWGEVRQRLAA